MSGRVTVTLALACAATLGCRTPTQITVEVRTDVVCESDRPETSITVGPIADIDDPNRAPVTVVTTPTCKDHRVGALVVVPSAGKDDELAIRVVTGMGKSADKCVTDRYQGGCIVARRALHFVAHESLELPIDMNVSCRDVPCDSTKTCVGGACVSDTISDPGACHGEGCNEHALSPTVDGGVPDSTLDATADSVSDVVAEAPVDAPEGGVDAPLDVVDAGGSTQWTKQLGDRRVDLQNDVAIDKDGNVYVASSFRGTTDVGGPRIAPGSNHDALLTKLSRGGVIQWVKQLGGPADDFALSVTTDAVGNVLLAGHTDGDIDFGGGLTKDTGSGDVYLAKYDSTGKYLVAKRFRGGNPDNPVGVAIDASGDVFFAGNTASDVDFGGGTLTVASNDIFLARFGPDLTHLKSKVYGGIKDDFLNGFAATKDGGVMLLGSSNGSIDLGDAVRSSSDGYDVFVARVDSGLVTTWSRMYAGPFDEFASAIAVDDSDRAVVGAFIGGDTNFGLGVTTAPAVVVFRLDKAGATNLTKAYPSSYNSYVGGIDTDATGQITLGGYFESTLSFGGSTLTAPSASGKGDIFVAQLDASGGHVRSFSYGDATASQQVSDLSIDRSSGAIVWSGSFGGTLAFPFRTMTTPTFEGFVARLILP